jgi:hypothetical protein
MFTRVIDKILYNIDGLESVFSAINNLQRLLVFKARHKDAVQLSVVVHIHAVDTRVVIPVKLEGLV